MALKGPEKTRGVHSKFITIINGNLEIGLIFQRWFNLLERLFIFLLKMCSFEGKRGLPHMVGLPLTSSRGQLALDQPADSDSTHLR